MASQQRKTEIDHRHVKRIRRWLELGKAADQNWYREANRWCRKMGRRYGHDYRKVAAILASMSPGTAWDRNKEETEALLAGKEIEFTTYPHNVEKARKILDSPRQKDYIALVKPRKDSGWKIGSFYRNITNPEENGPVTVDRHAIAICIGHAPTPKEQSITAYRYRCYAAAYQRAACEAGMLPHEVQAITWSEYRRRNGDLHQVDLPF
jgi:hypothetical protein